MGMTQASLAIGLATGLLAAANLEAAWPNAAPPATDAKAVGRRARPASKVGVDRFAASMSAIADPEGSLQDAGVSVAWFGEAGGLAREAGLAATAIPGWFTVSPADLQRPQALAAASQARFVAAAVRSRHGGLVWPSMRVFVKFREASDAASRRHAMAGAPLPIESVQDYEAIARLSLVSFDAAHGGEVLAEVARLAAHPAVEFAEADFAFTARRAEVIPNDPLFGDCWGLRNTGQSGGLAGFDMRSTEAWAITTGDPSLLVMVLETGVQLDHPDLHLAAGRDFTTGAANGIAGGGPGNACDDHGTPVAGCVSASIDNSIGVVGSCPDCRTVSAKVGIASEPCDGTWSGFISWSVNAINWAAANGVRVTNNSNDYGGSFASMQSAYAATRDSGVVHFASSGNSGGEGMGYPARDASVVAVGAANRSGGRASFSSFGSGIGLMAPGQSIQTADRTGGDGYVAGDYVSINGTSFSSPYAAGVAGLMLSADPTLSAAEVEQILFETARDMGAAGYDTVTGWGLVDARAALERVWEGFCPYDYNFDGEVDGADLGLLLLEWGSNTAQFDLDGDGIVGGADLGLLLLELGSCR